MEGDDPECESRALIHENNEVKRPRFAQPALQRTGQTTTHPHNGIKPMFKDDYGEGLKRFPGLFGGIIDDYRRRCPYYINDMTKDAWNRKTLSAALVILVSITNQYALHDGHVVCCSDDVPGHLLLDDCAGFDDRGTYG